MSTMAWIPILMGITLGIVIATMYRHYRAGTLEVRWPHPFSPRSNCLPTAAVLHRIAASCLFAVCIVAHSAAAFADPVPSSRRIDWSSTGVPGGVPNRTTVCATFSPGATAAAINSAIASCSNGVVYLNAGTYTGSSLNGSINLKNNVTLRGAGADKTIITGAGRLRLHGGSGMGLGASITGGATKGSTTFTVSSAANLAVGTMIEISRADDKSLIPFFSSWSPSNGRSIVQVNVVTALSGNTVTVRNPLIFDFASASPQVSKYYPTKLAKAGIEDLKVDLQGATGNAIYIEGCDSCWVKGTNVGNGGSYLVMVLSSVNLELRDNFIHDGGTGPNHAGISFLADYRWGGNSHAKVENNIINNGFPNIEINNDSSGLYIAYNYSPGSNGGGANSVTWNLDDNHAPFPVMNLYEGNIADMWGADGYFGGVGYATALRNHFTGYNPNFSAKGPAIALKRLTYNYNIVGNVLGSSSQSPVGYGTGCGNATIFELGYPNIGNCSTTPWDGYVVSGGYPDQKVLSSLLRWGNYDYYTRTNRFLASEIPSGLPVPADQTIPDSYAYQSTPSWWPSTIPWPPIGPDVTGGNGDTSGHVNKIPAQVCWETANLRNGGSFNASTCYRANAPARPAITSASTASGKVGTPFNYTITASNAPTSFNATGLPSGLTVNRTTGVISGTPTSAGTSSVTLSATNAAGTGTATLTLTISAVSAPAITSSLIASGATNSTFSYRITATNTPTSYNASSLPAGLTVDRTTGVISGTPSVSGSFRPTLSATNASGTGSATLALTIGSNTTARPSITSPLTASGTVGSAFSYRITASNTPTSYNASPLPAGLTINRTTGVISGTPTVSGSFSTTLSATNASGTGSATLALTIGSSSAGVSVSLFSGIGSPPIKVQQDPDPVELGVKFYATKAGRITGVRFYKNPSDTGTHTAHLWTSTGQLLASATFANETASGWQQVNFSTPVAVTAYTTYVASYHSNGYYGETDDFFSNTYTKGSLIAPSSGSSGGNSVYSYDWQGRFPSHTWMAANYWVDVVMQ
jgi:hypothetical protein